VAVNCRVVPRAILGLTGSIVIDCRVAGVTVRVVVPEIPSIAAVMVVEPTARAVANPLEPAVLLIEATAPSDELQVTCVVRSCVEPSEYLPVAVNCWVVPRAILGLTGDTSMETRDTEVVAAPPPPPPHPAITTRNRTPKMILKRRLFMAPSFLC
jgi:hypothetical protein